MTTKEVADQLVSLMREGKYAEIYQTLFHENAKSIEQPENKWDMPTLVEGLQNFPAKGAAFNAQFGEFYSFYVGESIVAGEYAAIAMGYEAEHKTMGRTKLDEIAVYHIRDGKVMSEQFFY